MDNFSRNALKPEETPSDKRFRRMSRAYPIFLILTGFAVWGLTVGHDFVWDDEYFVVRNAALRSWSFVPRYFTDLETMAGADYAARFSVFRPVRNLSYRLDFVLFGLRPAGWHLHNVLLHAVNACLLFFVAGRMGLRPVFSFVAGLVFLVHPLQSEVVCWVKGRDDLLAALFLLGALLVWLGPRPSPRRPGRLAAVLILYAAASLSKIQAVVLPALFLAQEFLLPDCRERKETAVAPGGTGRMSARDAAVVFGLLGLTGIGILFWRHVFLSQAAHEGFSGGDPGSTFLTAIRAGAAYLGLFLFPRRLLADYSGMEFSRSLADGRVWFAAAALLAFATASVLGRRRFPEAVCGVAWSALLILPVLNILPMQLARSALLEPMAERLCYTPFIGAALAAAALGQAAAKRWKRAAPVVIALLLIAAAGRSVVRAQDWKDKVTLFSVTVRDTPPGALRPRQNLLGALLNAGEHEAALPLARELWETYGDRAGITPRKRAEMARHLAFLLGRSGETPESRALLERAMELDASYAAPYQDLGIAAGMAGHHEEALQWFDRMVSAAPREETAHFNRGVALEALGRAAEAEDAYRTALSLSPISPRAHAALAALLWKQNRLEEAEGVYREALRLWPGDAECRYWLGRAREALRQQKG